MIDDKEVRGQISTGGILLSPCKYPRAIASAACSACSEVPAADAEAAAAAAAAAPGLRDGGKRRADAAAPEIPVASGGSIHGCPAAPGAGQPVGKWWLVVGC